MIKKEDIKYNNIELFLPDDEKQEYVEAVLNIRAVYPVDKEYEENCILWTKERLLTHIENMIFGNINQDLIELERHVLKMKDSTLYTKKAFDKIREKLKIK